MEEVNQNKGLSIEYNFKKPNEIYFNSRVPIIKTQINNSFQYYAVVKGMQAIPNKFIEYHKKLLDEKKEIKEEISLKSNEMITQNKIPHFNLESLINDRNSAEHIEVIISKILKQTILTLEKEIARITNKALEENGLETNVSGFGYSLKRNILYFVFSDKDQNIGIKHEYSIRLEGELVIKKTFFNNKSRYNFNY
ncbi:MAG: hypothetical protein ACP5OZ_02255 [Candidatus Woesearchaeota archaeon]